MSIGFAYVWFYKGAGVGRLFQNLEKGSESNQGVLLLDFVNANIILGLCGIT